MKIHYLAFALGGLLLTSCVGSQKYSGFVHEKLSTYSPSEINEKDQLKIYSNRLGDSSTQIVQVKNSFIPAILYWGWNSTIQCDIDDGYTTQLLSASIYKAADSLQLFEKLGDHKLEIHLDRVPGKFYYENKGHTLILLIAYTISTVESITPEPIDLVATYRIVDDQGLKSKGKIVIPNVEEPVGNVWKSTKKFTWSYLDRHFVELENMGWYLVEDIVDRI